MSDKVYCQTYEIDYKKVVEEIQETLYKHEKDLVNKLQEEKSPIKYIELKAILDETIQLKENIHRMFEYCKNLLRLEKTS